MGEIDAPLPNQSFQGHKRYTFQTINFDFIYLTKLKNMGETNDEAK